MTDSSAPEYPPQPIFSPFTLSPTDDRLAENENPPIDGIVIFRYDPLSQQSTVFYADEGFTTLTNKTVSDLQGKSAISLFAATDTELVQNILTKLIRSADKKEISAKQTLLSTTEPCVVHVSYNILPVDLNSHTPPDGFLVVALFRDLAKPSAEKLLSSQSTITHALHKGTELGQACFHICNQTEKLLGNNFSCLFGVLDSQNTSVPLVLGNLSLDIAKTVLHTASFACNPNQILHLPAEELPAGISNSLQEEELSTFWCLANTQPSVQQENEPPLKEVFVVASNTNIPPSLEEETIIREAASLLSTALGYGTGQEPTPKPISHDPLTQLLNRESTLQTIEESLKKIDKTQLTLSLFLVDIDQFQSINYSLGSHLGDEILKETARKLLQSSRSGDTVGRISSDQYLMICPTSVADIDVRAVAKRILQSINQPISLPNGSKVAVTASIGIAVAKENDTEAVTFLGKAESALKKATKNGRNEFALFDKQLQTITTKKLDTENALRKAVSNNELRILYQPLVTVPSGQMVGAEALIRWERPGFGLLPPNEFIPIAEESDLILDLGTWIIDTVCLDLATWPHTAGRSPVVAINLAAKQLEKDTLLPVVISALRRNNLHPSTLGFEITESMEIKDLSTALQTLTKLRELGSHIAIDDFGIGHATMEQVRTFSMANTLKVDRSFVSGLGTSREDKAIVTASLALAESLGMQVIAEGVETATQLKLLSDLGCDYAQGFGFCKPVPLEKVLALWSQKKLSLTPTT